MPTKMMCCGRGQLPPAKAVKKQFRSFCSEEVFPLSWGCWQLEFCAVTSPKRGGPRKNCAGERPSFERHNEWRALAVGNGSFKPARSPGRKNFTISRDAPCDKLRPM